MRKHTPIRNKLQHTHTHTNIHAQAELDRLPCQGKRLMVAVSRAPSPPIGASSPEPVAAVSGA